MNTQTSSELLPCPFCGQTDRLNLNHLSDKEIIADDWFVECERCSFSLYAIHRRREHAIAAWNRRPTSTLSTESEQMRERCFHDFLRLIQAYMKQVCQADACALQRFSGFTENHGIPGLGTGTCDCGNDDCPYATATVPCDCGLPDCSDARVPCVPPTP